MAAEIDLDAVPVDLTRAAVRNDLTELNLPEPGRPDALGDSVVDERTGLVLDLREVPRSTRDAEAAAALRRRLPRVAGGPSEKEDRALRGPRRGGRRPPASAPAAIAPPRSLPRAGTRPGGSHPEGQRQRRLNPGAAFVAVIAALALGIGVSAAVTGGRSLNPLTGLQQVVAQVTGGRTTEQAAAYRGAKRQLDAAQEALDRGDRAEARADLQRVTLKAPPLAPDDLKALAKRKASLEKQLGG
jgi:hypothetical protein